MASDRRKILRAIQREARTIGDPHARRVFKKAAVETGLVESNLTNPSGGDADSAGFRQERRSLYTDPTNIDHAVRRFREEFQQKYQPGEKSYDVAGQIQRPAAQYLGRYKERAGEAAGILKGQGDTGSQPNMQQGSSYKTTPGVDNSSARRQLQLAYLQNDHDPNALLDLAVGLRGAQDTPASKVRVRTNGAQPSSTSSKGGVADFEGKKVAAWIKPALEYARAQGWQGQVNSGYRSDKAQKRIYDSGVRPAAKPKAYGGKGSNHEFKAYPGGAVDVTDPEGLANILKRSKYSKKLRWAGAKDEPHFSHPHGGSY